MWNSASGALSLSLLQRNTNACTVERYNDACMIKLYHASSVGSIKELKACVPTIVLSLSELQNPSTAIYQNKLHCPLAKPSNSQEVATRINDYKHRNIKLVYILSKVYRPGKYINDEKRTCNHIKNSPYL